MTIQTIYADSSDKGQFPNDVYLKSMKISRFMQSHPKETPIKHDDLMSNADSTAHNSHKNILCETDHVLKHRISTKPTCRNGGGAGVYLFYF